MSQMEEEEEICHGRVDQMGLLEGSGRGSGMVIIIILMLNEMTWSQIYLNQCSPMS